MPPLLIPPSIALLARIAIKYTAVATVAGKVATVADKADKAVEAKLAAGMLNTTLKLYPTDKGKLLSIESGSGLGALIDAIPEKILKALPGKETIVYSLESVYSTYYYIPTYSELRNNTSAMEITITEEDGELVADANKIDLYPMIAKNNVDENTKITKAIIIELSKSWAVFREIISESRGVSEILSGADAKSFFPLIPPLVEQYNKYVKQHNEYAKLDKNNLSEFIDHYARECFGEQTYADLQSKKYPSLEELGLQHHCPEPKKQEDALKGAFSGAAATAAIPRDPLAFDLDGDGIEITDPAIHPVFFDLDNDGIVPAVAWLAPDDAWLALDRNGNGTIDSGRELFGIDTITLDGTFATSGFDALGDLDHNNDLVIDALDPEFTNLLLWQDLNTDGVSTENELFSLSDFNIISISLQSTADFKDLGGGSVQTDSATFTFDDGIQSSFGQAVNIDLALDTFNTIFTEEIDITNQAEDAPLIYGIGSVRNLPDAASLNPDEEGTTTLGNAIDTYLATTNKSERLAQAEDILTLWANTSTMLSLQEQAENHDITLTYKFRGTIPADQEEFKRKLAIIEKFSGFTYAGERGQASTQALDGSSPEEISVQFAAGQVVDLLRAYDILVERITQGLEGNILTNTYALYRESLSIDIEGITYHANYLDGFEEHYTEALQSDFSSTMEELVGMVQNVGFADFYDYNFDIITFLEEQVNLHTQSSVFTKTLSSTFLDYGYHIQHNESLISFNAANTGDFIFTNDKGTLVFANGGSDSLFGGDGADRLYGGEGNDYLNGGRGNDNLYGNQGIDIYHFSFGDGQDTINNYEQVAPNSEDSEDNLIFYDVLSYQATFSRVNGDDTLEGGIKSSLLFTKTNDDLILSTNLDRLYQ